MKGIHRSVPALPLSTQYFHTGPPSLPLCVPSLLSVSFSSTFLFPQSSLGQKGELSVQKRERAREYIKKKKKSESREQQLGADLQDSLETSVRPCLSLFLLPISSTGGSLCAQERLLYLGICGAPLGGWVEGGRVSEGAPQASAPL